jgi:hypothetical protein
MAEESQKFEIAPEQFRATWEEAFRQVFNLPENVPESQYENWPVFPDPIFRDGYKLAFLDTDLMLLNSDLFAKLQQFLLEIGETEFAILLTPYRNRGNLNNYRFPVDIDWETFRDDPMDGTLYSILPSFPQFITGQTGQWGIYYVMESDVYIAGYADKEVLSALQANFGIEGRNVELAEKLGSDLGRLEKLAEKGYLPELTVRQGRRFRELAEQIRAEDHPSEGD